jgi:hypothetical protein
MRIPVIELLEPAFEDDLGIEVVYTGHGMMRLKLGPDEQESSHCDQLNSPVHDCESRVEVIAIDASNGRLKPQQRWTMRAIAVSLKKP